MALARSSSSATVLDCPHITMTTSDLTQSLSLHPAWQQTVHRHIRGRIAELERVGTRVLWRGGVLGLVLRDIDQVC